MRMTPEEVFNQQVWDTLQDIQEEILATVTGSPVKYIFPIDGKIPLTRRKKILFKLEEKGAFKIHRNSKNTRIGKENTFYLYINQQKFDEICREYSFKCTNIESLGAVVNQSNAPISIEVFISDLQGKYLEIENEKNDSSFYLKIANYGKYLNDNEFLNPILNQLYEESQNQISEFKKTWEAFFPIWKEAAKNLVATADSNGIKDEGPLQNELEQVRNFLNQPEPDFSNTDLEPYYRSYQEMIWKFDRLGKKNLIEKRHLDNNNYLKLYPDYCKVEMEWNKFKRIREVSNWWAHYQVSRLACGVLGNSKEKAQYFKDDNGIDGFYKYEYEELSHNASSTPVILKRKRFEEWITRLHGYVIPRLKETINHQDIPVSNQKGPEKKGNALHAIQAITVPVGVEYNQTTHKIQFAEKEIIIPSNTDQDSLCKTIFKSRKAKMKEWTWDEMLEKWGGNYEDKDNWRKVYNAGREVNIKVASETAIKDLLLVKKLTVAINPKYLG